MVLPLFLLFAIGATNDWNIPQVAHLAYAMADLPFCRGMPSDEGAWNKSCAQKKLWVQLGPSEGGVEPERELPPEASVTVCSVGQSKFNSSVGVCYV